MVNGYDNKPIALGDRIELHPGCDLWMQGARFGTVVGFSLTPKDRVHIKLDKLPQTFGASEDTVRKVG